MIEFFKIFLICVFVCLILLGVGFCTQKLSNSMLKSACKETYFPDKAAYDDCVLRNTCKDNCDFDFKGISCPKECKVYYKWN